MNQTKNPMQVESPKMILLAFLAVINYLKTCFFFQFSLGLGIIISIVGFGSLLDLSTNFFLQFGIVLFLITVSMYFIKLDLLRWKKSKKNISTVNKIMIGSFLFIILYTEVIYFEIDIFEIGINSWATDEMKENSRHLFDIARSVSLISIIWYPIFFKSKELVLWIRKREKIIDDYEEKFFSLKENKIIIKKFIK